jgi:hypothetical protein
VGFRGSVVQGPVDFNDMLLSSFQPHWLNSFISTVRLAGFDFKLFLDVDPAKLAEAVNSPERCKEATELLRLLALALPSLYTTRSLAELRARFEPMIAVGKRHAASAPPDLSYWLARTLVLLSGVAEARPYFERCLKELTSHDPSEAQRVRDLLATAPPAQEDDAEDPPPLA